MYFGRLDWVELGTFEVCFQCFVFYQILKIAKIQVLLVRKDSKMIAQPFAQLLVGTILRQLTQSNINILELWRENCYLPGGAGNSLFVTAGLLRSDNEQALRSELL